jgi:amino acid transporter
MNITYMILGLIGVVLATISVTSLLLDKLDPRYLRLFQHSILTVTLIFVIAIQSLMIADGTYEKASFGQGILIFSVLVFSLLLIRQIIELIKEIKSLKRNR